MTLLLNTSNVHRNYVILQTAKTTFESSSRKEASKIVWIFYDGEDDFSVNEKAARELKARDVTGRWREQRGLCRLTGCLPEKARWCSYKNVPLGAYLYMHLWY